jgi:hypothetical protein
MRGRCVGLTKQCGILNMSELYRPPLPVTGIALILLLRYLTWMTQGWATNSGVEVKSKLNETDENVIGHCKGGGACYLYSVLPHMPFPRPVRPLLGMSLRADDSTEQYFNTDTTKLLCSAVKSQSLVTATFLDHSLVPRISNRNKLRGLSPRANYIDRSTASCRRS